MMLRQNVWVSVPKATRAIAPQCVRSLLPLIASFRLISMSSSSDVCPRCRKDVSVKAIVCPHCRTPLKAHGHEGIPLYQAETGTFLCDTCIYDSDDSCNYPQRPVAKDCIMYVDSRKPKPSDYGEFSSASRSASLGATLISWVKHNLALLILLAMIAVSLLMVLR